MTPMNPESVDDQTLDVADQSAEPVAEAEQSAEPVDVADKSAEPVAEAVAPDLPSMDDLRALSVELDTIDDVLGRLDDDPDAVALLDQSGETGEPPLTSTTENP